MKPILKLSMGLAAAVTLALAGNASAHDGGHGWGGGGGWHGGGYHGQGYYRGGFLLGVGFYPGYYGYPWGYPYPYPYYYPYPPPYGGPPPEVYRGEAVPGSSDSVEADVERALAGKGYYQGKIDGIIGPMAREAIRDYQRDRGQPVTGEINSRLLKSLDLD